MSETFTPSSSLEYNHYNPVRVRRFFSKLGDEALSKIIKTTEGGVAVQPTEADASAIVDACLDMYMQNPADDLDGEEGAFVTAEILKQSPQGTTRSVIFDVKQVLDSRQEEGAPVNGRETLELYARAQTLVSDHKNSALKIVSDRVQTLLKEGEIEAPAIPKADISILQSRLRETILIILDQQKISRNQAVGLLLMTKVETPSRDRVLGLKQKIAASSVFSGIQQTLKNRIVTFDVPLLKQYVGESEQTGITYDHLVVTLGAKWHISTPDAQKVVSQQLAIELKRYYESIYIDTDDTKQ